MNPDYIITTERLGLRPWTLNDIDHMTALNMNPEVMRYFPSTQDREQTAGFVNRSIVHQEKHGYCYFLTEILDTKEFIGFVGLAWQTYEAPFTPATDIGWRLKRSAWGKGYATEGAIACLDFAFNTLNLDRIVSVASLNNTPSINVMCKIGMTEMSQFDHPALVDYPDITTCVYYEIENPRSQD